MPSWWDRWEPLILTGAGIGANIIGSQLGSNAVNQANQNTAQIQNRLLDLGEQERIRRDQLTRALLPMMARDLRNPRLLGGLGNIGAQPSNLGAQYGDSTEQQKNGWGRWADEDWPMRRE